MSIQFLTRTLTLEGRKYLYSVYVPSNYEALKPTPLILFLHGAGEKGSDGTAQTTVGIGPAIQRHPERFSAIVVMPQLPRSAWWVSDHGPQIAMGAFEAVVQEFVVDKNRIYVTGISIRALLKGKKNTKWDFLPIYSALRSFFSAPGQSEPPFSFVFLEHSKTLSKDKGSRGCLGFRGPFLLSNGLLLMGGHGTWHLASEHPGLFAAAVPICPPGSPDKITRKLIELPLWVFHGAKDEIVTVECSRRMVKELEKMGCKSLKYTEYPNEGHVGAWERAYEDEEMLNWLFAQHRKK